MKVKILRVYRPIRDYSSTPQGFIDTNRRLTPKNLRQNVTTCLNEDGPTSIEVHKIGNRASIRRGGNKKKEMFQVWFEGHSIYLPINFGT